jgi:hypothetical protein
MFVSADSGCNVYRYRYPLPNSGAAIDIPRQSESTKHEMIVVLYFPSAPESRRLSLPELSVKH